MAIVKPFKAVRPIQKLADKIVALPYDVMNRQEAKEMAKDNPFSFLHISRSEINLPEEVDAYDPSVYQEARQTLDRFIKEGILIQDEAPKFYIYRQIMWGRVQTGIVAVTSIDDYLNDIIKKHEFTRPVKEEDRIRHFDYCDANTEPVFLTYRKNEELHQLIQEWIKFHKPEYEVTTEDGFSHILWDIHDQPINHRIEKIFTDIDYLYIADGHHRSASAVKIGLKRRQEHSDYDGSESFNHFLSVLFPDEDLFIMDYNRIVKDLNGHSKEEFLTAIEEKFDLQQSSEDGPFQPMSPKTFGMFFEGVWYELRAKDGTYDANDPMEKLDVSILQKNLLEPILGIKDPRTDQRIDFIGGIRGLAELEKRVCQDDFAVAFSMYPTTMDELLAIADAGEVMPPKSTWFEPKLRSGFFVHKLSD